MPSDPILAPEVVERLKRDAANYKTRGRIIVTDEMQADLRALLAAYATQGERIAKDRGALGEIKTIVDFEFGEMKRKPEIMDPLQHIGNIARAALSSEPGEG